MPRSRAHHGRSTRSGHIGGPRRGRRPRSWWRAAAITRAVVAVCTASLVIAGLLAGTIPAAAAAGTAAGRAAPVVPSTKSIPVTPVGSRYRQPAAMPKAASTKPAWPQGTATATITTTATAQAGALPVWLRPAPTTGHTPQTPAPATQNARVTIASQTAAAKAGVTGALVSVQRTDQGNAAGPVQLTIGYGAFAQAFGGDWATRLRLVTLPACALTTPAVPACRVQTPLVFTRDPKAGTLTAAVTLPTTQPATVQPNATTAEPAVAAAPLVVAADSSAGGGDGDYTATSLKPSGSWQAGGSADAFTWSYPISVPAVPGGMEPRVQLSYNSQAVDGLTSSTNNQASWIGDGWDYSPGFIERSYSSCHQNPAGATQTWDTCWSDSNTLTLSLNGQTTTLIRDGSSTLDSTTATYHPQNDSNERVQYETGAVNGAQNGEYWVITTDDGTQYYFGRNQLPGWASGDATTNSVWTEPVYATAPGQPCYNATFADSSCPQAYRWNLDYVVDTHSDVVSYFYNTETNSYANDLGNTATASYIRGGYLTKIQYGQRDGAVYSSSPAAQVLFTSTGRCNQSTCDPATLSSSTASNWPDVPYDLNCASGASCSVQGPSFWSEYALQSIQTQVLVGSTETNVDSWALTDTFPATGDNTTSSLWLSSITHTGQDTTAGGSSSSIALPTITFTGTPLSNRVDTTDGYPPITRYRLTQITTETGETIAVNYSAPSCPATRPEPSQNGALCYPDYWTPTGQTAPIEDWFNKFIVTHVTETDPTGGSNDTIEATYTPVGAPAWHYNDNPTTPTAQRTWDQWRGYTGMIVTTGSSSDPVMKTQYTYFRGMDGDTLPNGGTRSASVTDSRTDPAVTDANQYAGMTYETIVDNGSAVVTDTITDPWTSAATATHPLSGLPSQQSFLTGSADTKVYTPLANGSTRETETDNTHDAYGRVTQVNDQGDVSTTADDLCTTTTFADNATAWILDKPSEATTVSVNCATTPTSAQTVSDTQTFYDGSTTLGAAPTVGDATSTKKLITAGSTTYASTSQTVDEYGRTLTATDADQRITHTAYTPATGAQPTSVKVTDPKSHATTTTYDALRELPLTVTDPAGYVTTEQYDALGRLTSVTDPELSTTGNPPGLKYSYTVSNSGPSVVDTYTLDDDSTYRLSETLYDALLRARETQTQTPDNGRDITDTVYNTDGQVSETTDPYFNSSAVSTTYVQAQVGVIPSETGYTYDGAGRKTAAIAYALGTQTWQTTYTYGGNFVTTVPPAGGTASTTITDARGHTTDLYQYHAGVPADPVNDPASDYSDTHYTYTPAGKQATVVDAAGNTWSYAYDLLGNQTSATDPDTGTTTNTIDAAGQLINTTDARGKQTSYTYDTDGRKTAEYDTTGGAAETSSDQLAAWTYDTVQIGSGSTKAVGYPATTTSYSGGDTYTQTVLQYNAIAKPVTVRTSLTGEGTALVPSGGYVTSFGYTLTGKPSSQLDAAAGGLPSENVGYGYDQFGEPTSLASSGGTSWQYVSAVGYSEYGQPLEYTMPTVNGHVWLTLSYDDQTQSVADAQTTDDQSATVVDDTSYSYTNSMVSKGDGLVVGTTDKQNGGATTDTQCFTYDYATRLSGAWTATDNCAATPSPGNSATVGGPSPYWQSWTFDAAGDRLAQTDHDTTGNTANDTATTYTYPAAGSSTDQPHTLISTSATGPNAAANTASYGYDPSGNTTSITGGATGNQTLTWNDQNKLATDVTSAGTTSYVYDASGNLIVRRDPGQTTFFFGDEQLVLNTSTGAVTGTRYYTLGGATIALRVGGGNAQYLIPDRQGTDQLVVDSSTEAVTRRQFLPFGQTRGTVPTNWPGDTGYVGGTPDTATSLENLGAREYDPASGRFLSIDPVFEASSPNLMGGFDYAGNNPTSTSDATGLDPIPNCPAGDVACENCSYSGNCSAPGSDGGGAEAPAGLNSTGDQPAGQGSGKNYSTWHNRVALDALNTIKEQAAALGWKVVNSTLGLAIPHASKNCTDVDPENCNTGYADIVILAEAPNGQMVQFIWEVKKWTIGDIKANQEAQAYAEQMNANAVKAGQDPSAQVGWDINGPYQGVASGPNTKYWGGNSGAVIYGNGDRDEVKNRIQKLTDNGTLSGAFDPSSPPVSPYHAPQSAPAQSSNNSGGSGGCTSFVCGIFGVPVAPPVIIPLPIPVG